MSITEVTLKNVFKGTFLPWIKIIKDKPIPSAAPTKERTMFKPPSLIIIP